MIWSLHGAVGREDDWADFAQAVHRSGHEVRTVDLWSFVEEGGCSFDEFGAALCEQVRAEDAAPVLLGYSLGGRLALHALLADPGLWSAAVIVSAHPGLADEDERVLRMAADAHWAAQALTGPWNRFVEKWNEQGVLRESGGYALADRMALEARRQAVARGFMEWSLGKQEDLRPRLSAITCPVCWITGVHDGKFAALAGEAVPLMPRAVHRVVPGAGHRVPWEASAAFTREVERFLED